MADIVLRGDDLKFWKGKSEFINTLARWTNALNDHSQLVLSRDLFPDLDDDDWNFLRKFLHKKEVSYTQSKKYGTFVYNIKGYTAGKADAVLDFITYGKIGNADKVLNARRIRPRLVFMNNSNGNNNNRRNNNRNSNNNFSTSYKKRKHNTGVRVNNNNNNNYTRRKPYAKSKSKTKNRRH